MSRLLLLCALATFIGLTLVLTEVRWFARSPLSDRLRPYAMGQATRRRARLWSARSFHDVIGPIASAAGARVARLVGITEDVGVRLERVHADLDPTEFRLRQIAWTFAGFGIGGLLALLAGLPASLGALLIAIGPLLAFLLIEQQLSTQSERWQRNLFLELPVVAEQLAILLGAGYSLGGALNRLASRGKGACATDLSRVCRRIRHGLSEADALREWAEVARVPAIDRLVRVLTFEGEAGDLGRLVSDEARAVRREAHRDLLATIERRDQQVWIPVTVAALVPGVILLAVPFISALRAFTE